MRCNDVASKSLPRHAPSSFLIKLCQIITFLIFKSDNIENSGIELKGIVLPVPSNQIKVTFIIISLGTFVIFLHRNWKKLVDYSGGGGQRICAPHPSQIIGGPAPPLPTPMTCIQEEKTSSTCFAVTILSVRTVSLKEEGSICLFIGACWIRTYDLDNSNWHCATETPSPRK